MKSGIYKNSENRKAYLREYYQAHKEEKNAAAKEQYKLKQDPRKYAISQCMSCVRKLKKEIGEYSCNRVLDELEKLK
jgi:hypothetical protein